MGEETLSVEVEAEVAGTDSEVVAVGIEEMKSTMVRNENPVGEL